MSLRRHQSQFKSVIDRICFGAGINTIYCHVTPGGGKSILPIIAGKLITEGLADKMMWDAPRLSLIDQAEREFVNPYFRDMLRHKLEIRSSTNEHNPCRGLNGFATTYNAVGMDDGRLIEEFQQRRYILILDEFHHVQLDSLWHKKIQPLWDLAAFRIAFTGTLERGDGEKIAFLPYVMTAGYELMPDLQETSTTAVIRYTRRDALAERAIIPLSFHLSDGKAEWQTSEGKRVQVRSMDKMRGIDATKAIYTALNTEYADELLHSGLAHWIEHRRSVPAAKCLIVTSNIAEAKRHLSNLKKSGIKFRYEIATSEDSAQALKAINKMKAGKLDVLVTVAMAYEGLSIPSVSHIICLTLIRSTPWIEQMCARANRIDPDAGPYETQVGHIFAPADPLFKAIVAKIEAEQLPVVDVPPIKEQRERASFSGESGELFPGDSQAPGGIIPLSSSLTGKREVLLAGGSNVVQMQTASEIEADLREQIENHVRTYSFNNRLNPKKLNGEIYAAMGCRPRNELTIAELREALRIVRDKYPLSEIRGTGRPRVPTRAEQINVAWK